ncbi:MAG: diguanylate cyclase [Gammaproteobacteria bacterium]|nr:diguanylate cyclase [Gammaproteobacteria bacterium]
MSSQLSQQQLETLMENCPLGMLFINSQGQASWMNATLRDMLGTYADDVLSQVQDGVSDPLKNLFDENPTVHLEMGEGEEDIWLLGATQSIADNGGTMQFFNDVTAIQLLIEERDQISKELQEYILVDKESGMPNHRALFQNLEPQVARSRRYLNPLSVIIMRLNNLDDYVSNSSEASAGKLFTSLRYLLNDQMRWADIIGRLDTNEVLMVLPETHDADANKLVEKLHQRLNLMEHDQADFTLDASYGIAEWRKGDDVGLLMMRAREQLGNSEETAVNA